MKCNEIRELMPDLAAGFSAVTPEINQHLKDCGECEAKLNAFRQTMAMLDEWKAPEPSPYFDTRFQARLREEKEKAKQPAGWWAWLRRPALAGALAVVAVVGTTLYVRKPMIDQPGPPAPGTAVSDLQALDKNDDLYANFDELDDLQVQSNVAANSEDRQQ
jgi:cytochrome c-type biogenesis protein CcmH/NrfG